LINLVVEFILFLRFEVGVFIWSGSALEYVEEALSINSLNNGSGLIGLLVLLLLLDLLFGWVFTLIPVDLSTFDLFNLIFITLVEDLEFKFRVSEEFVLVEVESNE